MFNVIKDMWIISYSIININTVYINISITIDILILLTFRYLDK